MNNKKLLITIILLIVLVAGATVLYKQLADKPDAKAALDQSSESSQEADRQPAVDFTVTDADGNEVKLSDFFGKPIVLNFWASWCGPCKREMPDFNKAYGEYGDGVQFFMVNLTDGNRETVKTASSFIKDAGYKFPVYYDTTGDAATVYSVYSIPTTYFIDKDGNIVTSAQGTLDAASLQHGIDLIKEK